MEHAHSDYVQLLMETGVLGAALLLVAAGLLARRAWPLVRRVADAKRELNPDDAVSLAAGLGLTGLLMHAWVDFNLRIPALAILGAFFFGILMRQESRRSRVTDGGSGSKKSTFP